MKRTNTKKLMKEDVSDELFVGRFKRWPTCKLEKKKARVPRLNAVGEQWRLWLFRWTLSPRFSTLLKRYILQSGKPIFLNSPLRY